MAESSKQSIRIAAPVADITAVITDFARYPEWIGDVKEVEILEEFEDGYAHLVRFQLDAGILKDAYDLRYEYSDDLSRISWTLDRPSSVQKSQVGSYDISGNADGTSTVEYTLTVDLSIPMLGMFKRKAEKIIMDSALKNLKTRVEELA
ncbi:polyketide cyclase/dehydrase/lipid transport protein [Stackebrandtia albiflava]|uniref:Polyketide cyclase/dehydrase/lipid transport protein n=1 Tax=Stackebrandtia albiflava TaxID=406432 RepID=A0A562VH47_9ACTN|nr:SRPBCC family protein [Stackebrandtia albiflava]TWJ17117.1 polyketide cyclase/dehydrase/lipid transport protein [Stackebrandtia albiflava]